MNVIPCRCGGKMIEITKDKSIQEKNKILIIRDIPIYSCLQCNREIHTLLVKNKIKLIENSFKKNLNIYTADINEVFFAKTILNIKEHR